MDKKPFWTSTRADAMLAICGACWGLSYITMKVVLNEMTPIWMVTFRFGIAFLVVAAIFFPKLRKTTPGVLKGAAVIAISNFFMYWTLLQGLKYTTATNAGFLCATSVVITPILHSIIQRKMPSARVMLCCVVALIGIGCMTIKESLTFSVYDFWCLACAFTYATFVLSTSHYVKENSGLLLGVWQLFFTTAYFLIYDFIFEDFCMPTSGLGWLNLLIMALVCTAFSFTMQAVCQKYTTPEHASLMFCLEPVSSAFFGFLCFGEIISPLGYVGAGLILLAVVLCSVKPKGTEESKS